MPVDTECPRCKHEFEAEEWISSYCPECHLEYMWDSQYDEETGDEWCWVDWDVWEKDEDRSTQ